MEMIRNPLASATLLLGALLSADSITAGSPVYVGSKSHKSLSMDRIDHALWDALLNKYVDDDGMVDYQAFKKSTVDTKKLDRYLIILSAADERVQASRDARLAFWINAYNAVTIRGILREYPTSSIRNHTARLFGYNIWSDLKLYVGGKAISLEEIEHERLRKMNEPRIHFAIVCASMSCPRLLSNAYQIQTIEQQLEANSKDFFRRKQNFRYDQNGKRFYLSSILNWFDEDFGDSQAEILKTISKWLPSQSAKVAAKAGGVGVRYIEYDWSLNEQ